MCHNFGWLHARIFRSSLIYDIVSNNESGERSESGKSFREDLNNTPGFFLPKLKKLNEKLPSRIQ